MRGFIISMLKGMQLDYTVDKAGNIFTTKGESDTYPCVVSHIDEVHNFRTTGYRVCSVGDNWFGMDFDDMKPNGIGADDKNGIWVCLKALADFEVMKCAFFVSEETGCNGSCRADITFFDDCRFVLQCDRKGAHDLITNGAGVEICSKEFIEAIHPEKFGYIPTDGGLTDVVQLKEMGLAVSAVNISCGYYNPHTCNEMTRWSELQNCYDLVKHIITTCTEVYPHEYNYLVHGYGRGYNALYAESDEWDWVYDSMGVAMDNEPKYSKRQAVKDYASEVSFLTKRDIRDIYDALMQEREEDRKVMEEIEPF